MHILLAFMVFVCVLIWIDEKEAPLVCTKEATVDKIIKVNYRSAQVQMTDGTVHDMYQSAIESSTKVCLKYERIRK